MDDMARPATRNVGGVMVTMMGLVLAAAFAVCFAGESRPVHAQPDPQGAVGHLRSEVDVARGRATEWATSECRDRVVRAVSQAVTGRAVADAAWAACTDHPDALD